MNKISFVFILALILFVNAFVAYGAICNVPQVGYSYAGHETSGSGYYSANACQTWCNSVGSWSYGPGCISCGWDGSYSCICGDSYRYYTGTPDQYASDCVGENGDKCWGTGSQGTCSGGLTCTYSNPWYSYCKPIDNPPQATLTISPKTVTAGQTISITVSGTDDKGVYYINPYYANAWQSTYLCNNAKSCSYTWYWYTTGVSAGTYRVAGHARDSANQGTTVEDQITISAPTTTTTTIPDTTPPSISLSHSPSAPKTTDNINIYQTSSDAGTGVKSISVYLSGPQNRIINCGPTSVPCGALSPLTAGAYSYYAEALDFANNKGTSATYSFAVSTPDTTPPTVSVSIDKNPARPTDTVTITATASDPSGIYEIGIAVDGPYVKICSLPSPTPCSYSKTYTEGSHNYYAYAKDNSPDKWYISTNTQSFIVDGTPPTITIVSPSQGSTVGSSFPQQITTNENANCYMRFGSPSGSYVYFDTTGGTTHTKSNTGVGDGTKTFYYFCTDAAGNTGQSSAHTFTVSSCSATNCGGCTQSQCAASINCKWTGSSCVSCKKTQGDACTSNADACDGFWCSSNKICPNYYKWTGLICEQADPCYTNPCPYTLSQPQYWTTAACFYPNLPSTPSKSCCIVNYGTQTSDKLPIGTY